VAEDIKTSTNVLYGTEETSHSRRINKNIFIYPQKNIITHLLEKPDEGHLSQGFYVGDECRELGIILEGLEMLPSGRISYTN
jgi:hypothetical protein